MSALLDVKDLCIDYASDAGVVRAVDGVSFEIAAGEVFGLAGESGSGKSTVAQAILRILRPPGVIRRGQLLFEDSDVLSMTETQVRALRWRKISLVFQSALNALNPVMTLGAQICDVIVVHEGVTRDEARARAAELVTLLGLPRDRMDSYPHQLSGGMRQRGVLAIALALSPRLVILDEPTTALDVVVQQEIMAQLAELRVQLGFSMLLITHDLSLMFQVCDRIAILYAGRLVESGPAQALYDSPGHPYTRGLLRSFPRLDGTSGALRGIAGFPPDLRRLPAGCAFHPRCPEALERCVRDNPDPVLLGQGHHAACYLHGARGAGS